ncbi:hypothetical protein [Amycolatopsis albispora]|uniref:hypothetical protein n=1 Tax=Amycolatopsis albispora TaxID=1804986 RepID=UPI001F2EB832|nr:hypothetical protein [Amycolatopsis albispora]
MAGQNASALQPTISSERNWCDIKKLQAAVTVQDVYLLTLPEPYQSPRHPVPINATIVHALTLLHPMVPQPDGGRMFRCLTEFPGRTPGCLVPLSTLTYELDGGMLWHRIGDWERVVEAVVHVARNRECDAMPMGLPQLTAVLIGGGPSTVHELHHPDGSRSQAGSADRQQHLDELTGHIRRLVAEGPFWPGDNLVAPPREPWTMTYKPYGS